MSGKHKKQTIEERKAAVEERLTSAYSARIALAKRLKISGGLPSGIGLSVTGLGGTGRGALGVDEAMSAMTERVYLQYEESGKLNELPPKKNIAPDTLMYAVCAAVDDAWDSGRPAYVEAVNGRYTACKRIIIEAALNAVEAKRIADSDRDWNAQYIENLKAQRGGKFIPSLYAFKAAHKVDADPMKRIDAIDDEDERIAAMELEARPVSDAERSADIADELMELFESWMYARHDLNAPNLANPIAPIVETALKLMPIEADTRRAVIVPEPLREARLAPMAVLPEELSEVRVLGAQAPAPVERQLPLFDAKKRRAVIPHLPVELVRLGLVKGRTAPGRGAPIAERLLFEMLMAVPRAERTRTCTLTLTLREMTEFIWQRGAWRPSRQMGILRREMNILHNLRVVHGAFEYSVINVHKLPKWNAQLDERLEFDVYNLEGSVGGPLIHRERLRELGRVSAPAWRAFLRLAYIWDDVKRKRGGRRLYAKRPEVKRGSGGVILDVDNKPVLKSGGAPVTNWADPRAVKTGRTERNPDADKMPELGPDELIELCYDAKAVNKDARRRRLSNSRNALAQMEKRGAIVLEKDGRGGVRILEPYNSGGGDK